MRRTPLSIVALPCCLMSLVMLNACNGSGPAFDRAGTEPPPGESDAASAIAASIAEYLAALERGDAGEAAEYWAAGARLTGPGYELDRRAVVDGMRSVFATGTRVEILERRTVELFTHGDAAYEIARATEVFAAADGSRADTSHSNMFVQWARGPDGRWRFNRALISPLR